ncbi:MAG: glycosyltransferase family 39 protein [Acidimicrobiales bacterium]
MAAPARNTLRDKAGEPSLRPPWRGAPGSHNDGAAGRGARLARWGVIGVPALLAGVLAAIDLDARSLWLDEAATVSIASQHGAALAAAMAHDGGNMLGYYALIHVLIGWFGDSVDVLRLPSVIGGAATTAFVAAIAMRLFDRRVAIAAGLLSAISLPAIYWAQNVRSYALMLAFVAASYLALLALVEAESGRAVRRAGLAYVVAMTLAIYMSFVAVFVIPAQLVALVGHRRRTRAVIAVLLVVAGLCSPLAVLAAARGSGQLFWVPRPDLRDVGQVAVALASAGLQPNFHLTVTSLGLACASVVAFAAAAGLVVAPVVRRVNPTRVRAELVVLAWLVVPAVVSFVESRLAQPTFTARNLVVSLPAAAVLLARVVCDQRLPRLVTAGLLASFVGLRAAQLVPTYGVSPENWRFATTSVLEKAEPGDCIAFYPLDGRMAFTYYLDHPVAIPAIIPRPVWPTTPLRRVLPYVERYTTPDAAALGKIVASCPRLWFVTSHEGSPRGTATSRANYANYVFFLAELQTRYLRSSLATVGWASPIHIWQFGR